MLRLVFLGLVASLAFGQSSIVNPPVRQACTVTVTTNCTPQVSGAGAYVPPVPGASGGTVTSVGLTGTANQITVSGATPITTSGAWALSFPVSGVTLPATTTGTFSGPLTGNVTGNVSGTSATFTGSLTGDVTSTGMATTVAAKVPTWHKYSLVAIANGVNGCASANGCWQVNGVLGVAKAAGLTQFPVLFQLPAGGFVSVSRIKTASACTGTATATSGLGTVTNTTRYSQGTTTYDIQAAPGATNIKDSNSVNIVAGGDTSAATNVVASLVTTVQNIDQLVAGCAVDYWMLWGVMP